MCLICDLLIDRLKRERDLAKSRLEREKYDLLNEIVVDVQIARWLEKESASPTELEKALLHTESAATQQEKG